MTELVGDIVLNCTGGTPTAQKVNLSQADITVVLNTAVTSPLLNEPDPSSDPLLLVDEPNTFANPSALTACGSFSGCTYNSTTAGPLPNVFQGAVSANSVTFFGVPINPPGAAGSRIYRITNIRANASAMAAGPSGVPSQVVASIAVGGSTAVPVSNPSQIVGLVQPGLNFTVRDSTNDHSVTASDITLKQCVSIKKDTLYALLQFSEGFPTAFKPRFAAEDPTKPGAVPGPSNFQDVPGQIYNSETGFFPGSDLAGGATGLTNAGLAKFGTRLRAVFQNVPAGVAVWVSVRNVNPDSGTAVLVASGNGAFAASPKTDTFAYSIGSTDVAQLTVVNGRATAVWEVIAADPLSNQNCLFAVSFATTSNLASNPPSPALGTITVNGSFAPTYGASDTAMALTAGFPIPRFVDSSTPTKLMRIGICRTTLLFPFVSINNISGFDTGVFIANTSSDTSGTSPQAGSCSLSYYGVGEPTTTTTGTVSAGGVWASTVATVQPSLQIFLGYIIATCNFQYAQGGSAIFANAGAGQSFSFSPAQVIPDVLDGPRPPY